jgi:hypothetical protein
MSKPFTDPTSRPAVRRRRHARPGVESLETRQTPASLALGSSVSLILLNPQPLPPGSSPMVISYPSNPYVYYPPNFC